MQCTNAVIEAQISIATLQQSATQLASQYSSCVSENSQLTSICQTSLNQKTSTINTLTSQVTSLTTQLNQKTADNAALTQTITNQLSTITAYRDKLAFHVSDNIGQTTDELLDTVLSVYDFSKAVNQSISHCLQCEIDLTMNSAFLAGNISSLATCSSSLFQCSTNFTIASNNLTETTSTLATTRGQLQTCNSSLSAALASIAQLNASVLSSSNTVKNLSATVTSLNSEITGLKVSKDSLSTQFASLQKSYSDILTCVVAGKSCLECAPLPQLCSGSDSSSTSTASSSSSCSNDWLSFPWWLYAACAGAGFVLALILACTCSVIRRRRRRHSNVTSPYIVAGPALDRLGSMRSTRSTHVDSVKDEDVSSLRPIASIRKHKVAFAEEPGERKIPLGTEDFDEPEGEMFA
jgi:peptidoglycan hydrolase CwlO-like protein